MSSLTAIEHVPNMNWARQPELRSLLMRNAVLILLVLLVTSVWLPVQAANSTSESDQASSKTSDLTTLQGCVSFTRDRYVLTEENGTFHQLGRL